MTEQFDAFVRDVSSLLDLDAGLSAVTAGPGADVLPMPGTGVRSRDLDALADGVRDVLDVEAGLAALLGPRNPPTSSTVLIVDDHELVGASLATSLRSEGEVAHYHRSRSARDVLEQAGRFEPGLVVLDLDLGRDQEGNRVDGVRLVEPLCRAGWRVLVLSGSSDAGRIGAALAAGGFVWVPKNAPFPTLLSAIREARHGRSMMPAGRREQLIEMHRRREGERSALTGKLDTLTQREREVLALLAQGKRAQAVADHFVVSLATVRTQIRAILRKLDVGSQLEAVALHRRVGGR